MWRGSSQLGSGFQEGSGAEKAARRQQLLDATTQINALFSSYQGTHQAQQEHTELLPRINNINCSLPLILCEKSKEKWLGNSTANLSICEAVTNRLHFLTASLFGEWKPKLLALLVTMSAWKEPEIVAPLHQVESHVVLLATFSNMNSLKVLIG
ncbi:hypothetical protein CAL7716_085650 [Calothrix sp. PCC 7716]|nr:hypothetical protein CAL7716_085650 [Calothrix sp. PCC 7716]